MSKTYEPAERCSFAAKKARLRSASCAEHLDVLRMTHDYRRRETFCTGYYTKAPNTLCSSTGAERKTESQDALLKTENRGFCLESWLDIMRKILCNGQARG